MRLDEALRIQRGDVVSFIGAGGKTSALFRLARELSAQGWRVIGTTTTRIAAEEMRQAPATVAIHPAADPAQLFGPISQALNDHAFVFLHERVRDHKALGIRPDVIRHLLDRVNSDVILVEADGARRLSFKAPYDHEPVIPPETTQVVVVAGLDVLGQPLDSEHVYNPEAMVRRYGYAPGAEIGWPWVASVLRDETLGLRRVEPHVRATVLLNKSPLEGVTRRRARLIASLLLRSPRVHAVAIGAMQADDPVFEVRRPVAALVLAAGLSSRMGQPKVLLPWGRETVLESILRRLYMVRLDEIVVVTGHGAERVEEVAARLGVRTAHNPHYQMGEMLSSLQTGLRALDGRYEACLVVLGDQPLIPGYVYARLLTAYAERQGCIIAPSYQMRRGHPILIDRRHWPALLELPPGSAPREVINAHAAEIAYVTVNTDSILADMDTPDDYAAAKRRAGLA